MMVGVPHDGLVSGEPVKELGQIRAVSDNRRRGSITRLQARTNPSSARCSVWWRQSGIGAIIVTRLSHTSNRCRTGPLLQDVVPITVSRDHYWEPQNL